ncbi:MFS transporter [Streptomyces sparsogenes]|uniref:MFS transporter n=1 Tax=Streptomyces sparsogenes TaxID=67365 RepID=UPI0033D1B2CC
MPGGRPASSGLRRARRVRRKYVLLPRRAALVGFQAGFVAGHVAAALVPHFAFLLVMRAVTGRAYAGFWALASVTAVSTVSADRRGRAMAVVVSGLSLSMILGVPPARCSRSDRR